MNFSGDISFDDDNLDSIIDKLEDELKHVIDTLAPRKHQRQQHKVVCTRERVWLKYKLSSNRTAYKTERNIYNRLLSNSDKPSARR